MARNIITGIDAGTSTLRIIVIEQKKDGSFFVLGAGQKKSEGIKRGYIVNMDDATKSINAVSRITEKSSGIPVKNAVISIGGISLGSIKSKGMIMVSRADNEVTDYDIKRVIDQSEANLPNLSNKCIISAIPLSFKIDGENIIGRPAGMKGTKLEVETIFITCLNQHLLDLKKTMESAGIAVDDIIASPLAMSHATLTKQQKETGCILVNIGASTVSVVVFEEGNPVSLEVFPIGSVYITNDIALGMRLTLEEAEKIKIDFDSESSAISKRKLSDIIEARLSDIFDLIESHLKKINRNGMLPAGIILTGGGSNLINLDEIAKASLRLPAKIGILRLDENAPFNVTFASNSLKELISNDPAWSIAFGLCISGFKEGSGIENINIFKKIGNKFKNWFKLLIP